MSKKNKKYFQAVRQPSNTAPLAYEAEYGIIKRDLLKVVIFNAIYLAAVLALYYSNHKSQYLEKFFSKVLHF